MSKEEKKTPKGYTEAEKHAKVLAAFHVVVPRIKKLELKELNATIYVPRTKLSERSPLGGKHSSAHVQALRGADHNQRQFFEESGLTTLERSQIEYLCQTELKPVVGGELSVRSVVIDVKDVA